MMRKIANCLLASALVPFLNAPLSAATDPFWPRLEDMVERSAYPLALYEINHAARPDAEKTHLDYLRGYCLRRMGQDPEKALNGIPRSSVWFLPARIELSEAYLSSGKTEKAAETMALAVSMEPLDERVERLADLYFVLGKYEKAAECYEKLSKRKPAFLYSLAWCHTRLGNYPKAMATWQTAISRLPQHPMSQEARLCLANSFLQLGRPLKASEQFRFARELDRAEFLAAEGLMGDGKNDLAIAHYRLVKGPFEEAALYGLSFSLGQQGRLEEAKKSFRTAINRFPKGKLLSESFYSLGRILELQGLSEEARAAYEKSIDADQGATERSTYRLVALLFNKGKNEETILWARKLEKEFPKSEWLPPALWAMGESAFALSDYPQAIAAYDKLVASENLGFLKNRGEEIKYRLGIAYLRNGKFEKAIEYLLGCQANYAEDALFWRAEATYRLGKSAQALWSEYLKRYPRGSHRFEAQYGLAWGYYRQSMLPEAANRFKLAAEGLSDPKLKRDALNRWGSLMAQLGNWSEAKEAFDRVEKADPSDPGNRFQKALCAYRLGQLDDAGMMLESFVSTNPSAPQNKEARSLIGQIKMKQGRFDEAAAIFETLSHDPALSQEERFEHTFKLAACYQNSGKAKAASEVYSSLMKEPDLSRDLQGELKGLMARANLQSGDLDSARLLAEEDATASLWAPETLDEVSKKYFEKKDFSGASKTLLAMKNRTPEQDLLLAHSFLSLGDATKSIPLLRELSLKKNSLQRTVLFELNKVQREDGRFKEALISFGRLSTLFPGKESVQAGMDLARASRDRKEPAVAREVYKAVAQGQAKTPVGRAACFALGELAIEAHDYREAAIAFRRAETASPPHSGLAAQASYWLGYTLVADRRFEDAIAELARLKPDGFNKEEIKTWLPLAWLKQGEAYENLRRFSDAEKIYKKVLVQGEESERREAKKRLDWIAKNIKKGSKK